MEEPYLSNRFASLAKIRNEQPLSGIALGTTGARDHQVERCGITGRGVPTPEHLGTLYVPLALHDDRKPVNDHVEEAAHEQAEYPDRDDQGCRIGLQVLKDGH